MGKTFKDIKGGTRTCKHIRAGGDGELDEELGDDGEESLRDETGGEGT